MARRYAEQVADNMLNRYGLTIIWQLHLSAAQTYRDGNARAAMTIIEIADAAEDEWHRRAAVNLKSP